MQATQKMYSELIKTTAGVRMVGGQDITPSRKMPRGGGTVSIRPARATGEKPKGNNAAMKQANGNGSSKWTFSFFYSLLVDLHIWNDGRTDLKCEYR